MKSIANNWATIRHLLTYFVAFIALMATQDRSQAGQTFITLDQLKAGPVTVNLIEEESPSQPFEEIRIMNATWSSQGDFRIDEGGTDCPDLPARCSDVIRLTNANSGTATIFVLSDISDAELNVDLLPSFGSGDTFPAKVLQESIGGTILVGDISTKQGATIRIRFGSDLSPTDSNRFEVSDQIMLELVPAPPPGSCQAWSTLSVLVTGTNVVAYVPKGIWPMLPPSATGVSVVNIEGSGIKENTMIPTTKEVSSCASNSVTGQTVCTTKDRDVYLLTGTTVSSTLTSSGSGTIKFSGGECTNCGVAVDAIHNRAVIGLSFAGMPGFQFLNLGASPSFEEPFLSRSGRISEGALIDPFRNLLLSAGENIPPSGSPPSGNDNYEIIDLATSTSRAFFEQPVELPSPFVFDSTGEDCNTGIALASAEYDSPFMPAPESNVFIADLTQATFTPGSPGMWTAPSQIQTLSESKLMFGASGVAVAQGTHTGVLTGETCREGESCRGHAITAIALPATSGPGTGTPAIVDWVTCRVAEDFSNGFDPHFVTAYQSPNSADAIAVLASGVPPESVAVVDLTKMLDTMIVPRTPGGHRCASDLLPETVVSRVILPGKE